MSPIDAKLNPQVITGKTFNPESQCPFKDESVENQIGILILLLSTRLKAFLEKFVNILPVPEN